MTVRVCIPRLCVLFIRFEEGREDDISADELNISFGTHATNSPLSASVSPSISAKQLSNRAASLAKSERAFEDDLREERE